MRQDKLVVFLTGDQSVPSQSTRLLKSFARYGFPTIGLSYDTDDAADALDPCKELVDEAETGEAVEALSLTSSDNIASTGDRRFSAENVCEPKHASFAVDASMYDVVSLASSASCTSAPSGFYLRELYEDLLCQAAYTTCSNSHDTSCETGDACPGDLSL